MLSCDLSPKRTTAWIISSKFPKMTSVYGQVTKPFGGCLLYLWWDQRRKSSDSTVVWQMSLQGEGCGGWGGGLDQPSDLNTVDCCSFTISNRQSVLSFLMHDNHSLTLTECLIRSCNGRHRQLATLWWWQDSGIKSTRYHMLIDEL